MCLFLFDLLAGQALQVRGRLKQRLARVLDDAGLEADGFLDDLAGLSREHAAFAERRTRAEMEQLINLIQLDLTWNRD